VGQDKDTSWFGNLPGVAMRFAFPSKAKRLLQQRVLKRNFREVQGDVLADLVSGIDCDINVATYCLTAGPTLKTGNGRMFYLVQNYEPFFFSHPAWKAKAEESYRLPLTKLCVSKWLRDKVGGSYIGNGVNTQIFHPENSFKEKEDNSILYFYRGISWKGDSLALKTLTQLHHLNPNTRVHIVARQNTLDKIFTDFPFELHVELSDVELSKLYSKVRVLLFASSFEGYGLPPLEALACGSNVVSTDFAGNEYLVNGYNCLIANNPDSLANSALKLFADDTTAQEQLENSKFTVKIHDFDVVTHRLVNAVCLTIGKPGEY
jgi:glycosyltransferase involved in cell wall biosynthesis